MEEIGERKAIQMGARMRFRARSGDKRRNIIVMPPYRVIFHTKYLDYISVTVFTPSHMQATC